MWVQILVGSYFQPANTISLVHHLFSAWLLTLRQLAGAKSFSFRPPSRKIRHYIYGGAMTLPTLAFRQKLPRSFSLWEGLKSIFPEISTLLYTQCWNARRRCFKFLRWGCAERMVNNDRASVNSGERRRWHKVCKTDGGTLSVSFASALKVTQKQQQPGVNNNLISWRRNADLDYSQRASHPCSAKWKWPWSQFVFIAHSGWFEYKLFYFGSFLLDSFYLLCFLLKSGLDTVFFSTGYTCRCFETKTLVFLCNKKFV